MTNYATPAERHAALKEAYLFCVENWAPHASEIADHLFKKGLLGYEGERSLATDKKVVASLLKTLDRSGLIQSHQVNGEGPAVHQSMYDIENSDVKETRRNARKDFKEAFPEPTALSPRGGQPGATGPRYTPAQIKKGLAARKAGKTNKEVAEAAGVKSPSYFSKVLKAEQAKRDADARLKQLNEKGSK